MEPTQTRTTPNLSQKRVNITLSLSGGRILLACADQIGQLQNGPDTVTPNVLAAIRNDIETRLGLRGDVTTKESCSLNWSEGAFNLMVWIVSTAHRLDPKNPDNDFREALLKRFREANPVTHGTDRIRDKMEKAVAELHRIAAEISDPGSPEAS